MRRCAIVLLLLAASACGTGAAVSPEPPTEIHLNETEQAPSHAAEVPGARADDGSWSGVLSCAYRISHGWGNIYECTLVEALDGTAPPGPIGLHLTVDDTRQLSPGTAEINDFVGRFFPSERPYGPPSGYRDASGVYWVLVIEE